MPLSTRPSPGRPAGDLTDNIRADVQAGRGKQASQHFGSGRFIQGKDRCHHPTAQASEYVAPEGLQFADRAIGGQDDLFASISTSCRACA